MITSEPMILEMREPKQRRKSGIYQITCEPTGRVYIGSAVWLAKRKRHHREGLTEGTHGNSYLQRAWNKYGPEAFTFAVLEYVEKEKLIEREQFYIDNKKAADHQYGFNMLPTAGSPLGRTYGPEFGKRISEQKKGKCFFTDSVIEDIRKRMLGNTYSLGRKATPEQRERMRKTNIAPTFTGHRHSDKSKALMSLVHKGKPLKEEHKEKIAQAHRGKKQTAEHRIKLALSQTKVKPFQREEIRALYVPGTVTMGMLAAKYNISKQTVCNVINGVGVI